MKTSQIQHLNHKTMCAHPLSPQWCVAYPWQCLIRQTGRLCGSVISRICYGLWHRSEDMRSHNVKVVEHILLHVQVSSTNGLHRGWEPSIKVSLSKALYPLHLQNGCRDSIGSDRGLFWCVTWKQHSQATLGRQLYSVVSSVLLVPWTDNE